MSQNLTDIEVIDRFKQQISWADETRLLQHGDRTFLKTGRQIYYPVRWDHVIPQELAVLQTYFERKINVLIWGNPTKEQASKLFWLLSYAGFSSTFIDAVGRIAWAQCVRGALDGVDWGRSLSAIAEKGNEAKPVYEWD